VTCIWDTRRAEAGVYRISTFGVSKNLLGTLTPYEGLSSTFVLN
jgi:hypothetical protein